MTKKSFFYFHFMLQFKHITTLHTCKAFPVGMVCICNMEMNVAANVLYRHKEK